MAARCLVASLVAPLRRLPLRVSRSAFAAALRWRGVLLRLLALALGSALALLVLEFGLRVAGYDGARERELRVFDAKYGTVNADSWIFSFHIDPARHRAV